MITGLSVQAKNMAITQYLGIPATGAAMLNGKMVVTTADGIHVMDNAQSDNGTSISACVKTLKTDFGRHARKRVRTMFVRGLFQRLEVLLSTETQTLELEMNQGSSLVQGGGDVQGQRAQSGVYWQFGFKNISGEDFSIDGVDAAVNTLSLRR